MNFNYEYRYQIIFIPPIKVVSYSFLKSEKCKFEIQKHVHKHWRTGYNTKKNILSIKNGYKIKTYSGYYSNNNVSKWLKMTFQTNLIRKKISVTPIFFTDLKLSCRNA